MANLPSPYDIGNSLNRGIQTGSSLMQQFLQNKRYDQEKPLNDAYKQAQLQELQRQQQLLPYLIQQHQDIHNERMSKDQVQNFYSNIIKNALSTNASDNPTIQPPDQQNVDPSISGLPQTDQSNINQMQPGQSYVVGSGQQPQQENIGNPTSQGQSSQQQNPSMGQQPIPAQQAIASSNAATPEAIIPQGNQQSTQQEGKEQEQIIQAGNPKLSQLDKIAGLPGSPIPAPKVVNLRNGETQIQYPSGKITRIKSSDSLYQAKRDLPTFVMQKNLYANNIEKTLKSVNLDDLTHYNGPGGKSELGFQMALDAAHMKTSDAYKKYVAASKKFDFLAGQVRQFYGDSVQPSEVTRKEKKLDPRSAFASAEIGKIGFNSQKDLLEQELQTYRDASTDPSVYLGNNPSSPSSGTKKWVLNKNGNLVEG